jgi:uncharacterized membrane protein YhaH (DUF805 family)
MLESYKLYWKNYVNFRGRTPRRGYWWVQLWNLIIGVVLVVIMFAVGAGTIMSGATSMLGSSFSGYGDPSGMLGGLFSGSVAIAIISVISLAFSVANIIPGLALSVRRLHDTGRRWPWIFIMFAPVIFTFILALIAAATTSLGALGVMAILSPIVSLVVLVIWIILMCLPTSPNAIGCSTHDVGGGGIVGLSGIYSNITFPIEGYEEIVIGRDAAFSHIVLNRNAEKISRKHVSIGYDPNEGMYVVTDLSSNGTYLNDGTRLSPGTAINLAPGSIIYLAKQDNSFRLA